MNINLFKNLLEQNRKLLSQATTANIYCLLYELSTVLSVLSNLIDMRHNSLKWVLLLSPLYRYGRLKVKEVKSLAPNYTIITGKEART